MRRIAPRIALALLTAAACVAASAQTSPGSSADEARRDQNRDEALSTWRQRHPSMAHAATASERRTGARADRPDVVPRSVRRAGHRVAEKAREITDKTESKFDKPKRTP